MVSSSDVDSKWHDHAKKNNNQNSNVTESCEAISKPLLPEDLIFNILTFVSLNCLINSARYVCKTWAATITSLGFSEAYECHARSKHGLYVESSVSGISSYFLEFKDGVNGEFERTDLGIPQGMGKIISSCGDGLLLLSANYLRQVFVVNPVLKWWLRIPPFPSSLNRIRYACRCMARVPRNGQFKLFLVELFKISYVKWYVFYVLRIGIDNSWKEIARRKASPFQKIFFEQIFSGGNNLYCRIGDEVIVMDADKEIIVHEYPLLTESMLDGLYPRYLCLGNCFSCIAYDDLDFSTPYKVFILDFDSGKWSLYHEMGPFDFAAAYGHELQVLSVTFCFWTNDHIIFRVFVSQNRNITTEPNNIHFVYNVKTRQLKKIKGIGVGNFEVWLHTNRLASLPSTLA